MSCCEFNVYLVKLLLGLFVERSFQPLVEAVL